MPSPLRGHHPPVLLGFFNWTKNLWIGSSFTKLQRKKIQGIYEAEVLPLWGKLTLSVAIKVLMCGSLCLLVGVAETAAQLFS